MKVREKTKEEFEQAMGDAIIKASELYKEGKYQEMHTVLSDTFFRLREKDEGGETMLKAKGKCSNCQCKLSLSRELGCSYLGKLCPVCGCETMEWVDPKSDKKKVDLRS